MIQVKLFPQIFHEENLSCEVNTISKLDSNLSIIWQSNPLNNYSFTNFEINSAGNIYVTGEKDTCNGEMIVCSFDSTGVLLFSKIYGGDLNDEGESIICLDTNYVIAIGTHSIHEWAIYEARIPITSLPNLGLSQLPVSKYQ